MAQKLFIKNFTLLVFGQVSSLFGNFILRLALSMYILDVTGSAAVFAGILSAAAIPTILLSPFGGILADRTNRRNIMIALDALTGISVLCAALLFSPGNDIAIITVLLVILSILGAFETPTVQSCVPQMLTGENIIKGNAVINQVASISYFVGPILGGALYAAFGLKPVMYASIACFFITALFECFIKLDNPHAQNTGNILSTIKHDFSESVRFIGKEQPSILKMLLLASISRFFVMGIVMVGFPYIVRTVLGLSSTYYGAAEGALAIATILGSVAAGLLTGKLKTRKLSVIFAAFGAFIIPAGVIFLLPAGTVVRYIISIMALCGVQIAISIFSIFAVSLIQQKTPGHLIGKVMAYTVTVTMCVQPLGQIAYGFLFDGFSNEVYLVLIPTGIIVCVIGLLATDFFRQLEKEQDFSAQN
ncbi:MAG: MFS transporter [Eubacterium sp.]|jgi:MFS family permease|nr:MFS transporter [Eubacterium sp.]